MPLSGESAHTCWIPYTDALVQRGALARVSDEQRILVPQQYAEYNRRAEEDLRIAEFEIRRPISNEKRITRRTRDFRARGFYTVLSHDRNIDWHREMPRAA